MSKRECAVIAIIAAAVSPIIAEVMFTRNPSTAYLSAIVVGVGMGYLFNYGLNFFVKETLKLLKGLEKWLEGSDEDNNRIGRN